MMRIPARTLPLVAVLTIFLAACGGGGSKTKTVERTVPAPEPTARAVYTGEGAIDQIIGSALASDDIGLAGLVGYQKVACAKESAGAPGDPPRCRDTEAEGTPVEVFAATTACNPGWVRPEQVPDVFRADFPKGKTTLTAVARLVPDPVAFGGLGATEVAVFKTGEHPDSQAAGVALHLANGRVVWAEADCTNAIQLIAPGRVASFILDPSGTRTASTPAAAAQTPAP